NFEIASRSLGRFSSRERATIELRVLNHMHLSVIRQRGDFGPAISIPRKLADRQSAQASANFYTLDARLGNHLLFATPTVYDHNFVAGGGRDVHKWIVVQTAKLDRSCRSGQRLLHHRVVESLRGIVKY